MYAYGVRRNGLGTLSVPTRRGPSRLLLRTRALRMFRACFVHVSQVWNMVNVRHIPAVHRAGKSRLTRFALWDLQLEAAVPVRLPSPGCARRGLSDYVIGGFAKIPELPGTSLIEDTSLTS